MAEQAKFLTGSPLRHVVVMSATSSLGLMAVFIVDLVDMIFISMLGKEELAAAIGYAGSILFLTTSVSIAMAIAAGAIVARALGAGDAERAREAATHAMFLGFLLAVAVAILVWLNIVPLARLMGASGVTLDLSVSYLSIIIPSMPILMLAMAAGAVLRAHGDAKRAMWSTLAGGLVNAVLDPILIFGMGLELQGAAIASVLARITIAAVAIWPLIRVHRGLSPLKATEVINDVPPVWQIAFPALLTNLATPFGAAYVTRSMAAFGEEAVAGAAIIGRLTPVAFALIFALSGAIGPIIGQNFGASRIDRVRQTVREGLIFTAIYVLFASAVLFVLRAPIADLFSAEGLSRDLVFLFCGPLALSWFFTGILFVGNAGFNNLGHPFYSTWVNWGRNTLGTVPPVILGAYLFGAPGVLIGQAAGALIFAAISLWLISRVLREVEQAPSTVDQVPHFTVRARLVQLFGHRR